MITAHGGALGTGRNTRRYFDNIDKYRADALEIDIWKRNGVLYLSHLPALFSIKNKITLKEALEIVKMAGLKVNCDVKKKGITADVIALAKEVGVQDNIYFTGAVTLEDSKIVDAGEVWLNTFNFKDIGITPENAAEIKKIIDATGNPRFRGINIHKKYATDEFMKAAKEAGLGLSVYTVDDAAEQARLLAFGPDNITTNQPVTAREAYEKL